MNKSNLIICHCFIYNFVERKIYDYLHEDATQAMFKEKVAATTPKDNVVINMVLVITIHNQIPKNVVFKEKEPLKNKNLAN